MEELEDSARLLRSNPRWQTRFRQVVELLRPNHQRTVENELVTAQSEDPEHFLVLLKTLTDRHYLSRSKVRCFIDSKCENVTPTVFRNALRKYRRLFLKRKNGSRVRGGVHALSQASAHGF
jgi:hypothetical protein